MVGGFWRGVRGEGRSEGKSCLGRIGCGHALVGVGALSGAALYDVGSRRDCARRWDVEWIEG